MSCTKKSSQEPPQVPESLTTMINDFTIEDFGLPHANIPEHSQLERCDKCCRTFRNWDHLENHRAAHRTGQVQYWCLPQCGEGYTSAAGLQKHQV